MWPRRVDVFVVGDSISMHYGDSLEEELRRGGFSYARKGSISLPPEIADEAAALTLPDAHHANGGDSRLVADYLELLAEHDVVRSQVLAFNAGLHDVRRARGDDSECRRSEAEYRDNLERCVRAARRLARWPVWITTTPVVDSQHAAFGSALDFSRRDADRRRYRAIADEVMRRFGVTIIDLGWATGLGLPDDLDPLDALLLPRAASDIGHLPPRLVERLRTPPACAAAPASEHHRELCDSAEEALRVLPLQCDHVHFHVAACNVQGHLVATCLLALLRGEAEWIADRRIRAFGVAMVAVWLAARALAGSRA